MANSRAVRVLTVIVAVGATIVSGLLWLVSIVVAPLPWVFLSGAVWMAFVGAAIWLAARSQYRALVVPIVSIVVAVAWLFLGERYLGWGG